jgi:hypothetical protein
MAVAVAVEEEAVAAVEVVAAVVAVVTPRLRRAPTANSP